MTGVVKLDETNTLVNTLQDELVALQPVLSSKAKEAEELLAQVAVDQEEAEEVAKRVGSDEALVKQQQREVATCQADAQRDVDQALPALNAAVAALDSLDKKDITEVKGFVKPPQAVQMVMEAVCIMLGEKADWDNSKRILSRSTFMIELKEYDKDNIPAGILKRIRKYIENPEFAVDEVKKVSHAAMSLCMWVHAIDTYARVFREVAPKRQRLAEMNSVLADANSKLAAKQQELSKVMEKVRKLKKKCEVTLVEKQRLIEESELTRRRLQNAEKLTVGLDDERIRWKGSIELLKQEGNAMLGDSFLAAAYMSYLGPFDGSFRDRMLRRWENVAESSVGASMPFKLANAYGDSQELLKAYQHSPGSNKRARKVHVKLCDLQVETDVEHFRLYLTTKLPNPHFVPDVFIRVNVVNFTVTSDGLEEQLLSDVVQRERMEVEERKHTLLASNILDDVELIKVLETSKKTSIVVAHRLAESEATKQEVLEIRNQYHTVAAQTQSQH
ncbi:hypothetical protein BBP00_00005467 [Phytophthora kernoviae]|uniref:Dynein heavy chain coiled coil stalk domain-containing protein n=1 Tax=Phytophthora kernoviae TaxID=325452 RepID=A0A3F2RQT0_9STRA|nr:hypothetical protein BBP00_00005467 [Phytophthora kernoviae]